MFQRKLINCPKGGAKWRLSGKFSTSGIRGVYGAELLVNFGLSGKRSSRICYGKNLFTSPRAPTPVVTSLVLKAKIGELNSSGGTEIIGVTNKICSPMNTLLHVLMTDDLNRWSPETC